MIVALLGIAAAIMVVRIAFAGAYAEEAPARAAAVWPGHPQIILQAGLARIGQTAAAGRPVADDIIDPLLAAAREAPLAPEPFLIRGVQLRIGGDEAAAGQAFGEAKRRDPRSIASRFFLADHYLRTDVIDRGLGEIAVLSRLVPGSQAGLAPILASYAQRPGAADEVKKMLRSYPELEPALLYVLAADAGNSELILSLASEDMRSEGRRPPWQPQLVKSLVSAGQYGKAHAVWARLMEVPTGEKRPLLFDPKFEAKRPVAPFAWALTSSAAGLVEPGNGGIHIIYYGRENKSLASQLLLLAPGSYGLSMEIPKAGKGASSLVWTVTCLPSKKVIMSLDLATAGAAPGGKTRFSVPGAGCGAQRLELSGKAPEFPQTVDVSLSDLALSREGR